MKKFIVCDIGKNFTHVYNPQSKNYYKIEHSDFIKLNIPELTDGVYLVIEDAHLRTQEENSLAQAFTIDELMQLKSTSLNKNNTILSFPQKVTPKARKIASLEKPDLIEKTDQNDVESIAYYLKNFPNVFGTLKEFNPITLSEHEKKSAHIYFDRDSLTEDSNTARNEKYGIKTSYDDAVTRWIKKYISVLAFRLSNETREFAGLDINSKGYALKPGILNYTSDKLKFVYGVVNTILNPKTGELRVRSDNNLPPYWKYAKQVYFGITPYHMHAGVTASNYKYHKRKAGSLCKLSMSLESKTAIKNIDDVCKIREEMNRSDKNLRNLWREIRKMIVEDNLR
jgi:hypothetical protein